MVLCADINIFASEDNNVSMELLKICVKTPTLIISDSMTKINKKRGAFSVDGWLYVIFFIKLIESFVVI